MDSSDDESQPYKLCVPCHHRLTQLALRPLEWFRLALRHCPHKFLLHDDFYHDDGTADQPREPVQGSDKLPAPTLAESCSSIPDLWSYTLTRYTLKEQVFEAWRNHPQADVLAHLVKAYESREDTFAKAIVLEISAHCLKRLAGEIVRRAWEDYPDKMYFGALAKASLACLPDEEAFDRCLAAFDAMPLKDQRQRMMYMRAFRNRKLLDWIERRFQPPVTDDWGRLASCSGIGWSRIQKWLSLGRPLSLVALDALLDIFYVDEKGGARNHRVVEGLPPSEEFENTLRAYQASDTVPRVENSIHNILEGYTLLNARS